jgi:phosphate:Na+ symporter
MTCGSPLLQTPLPPAVLFAAADPPWLLLGIFLAGLALFFIGVDAIKLNLRQLTSRRFRAVMGRLTSNGPIAAIWGVVFGAISQSATAVSFIMVGMLSGGLLAKPRALLVIAWANVGTTVLVFLAAVDIRAAVFYLIGVCGLAVTFEVSGRFERLLRVLLGAGLLLLGLELMRDATRPMPQMSWFEDLGDLVRRSGFGVFLLGAVLRLVIQSSSAIVIVGISFAVAGIFAPQQVVLLMFGTAVGVGGSVVLLSGSLKGAARQLTIYQGLLNTTVGLGLLLLYYAMQWTGTPLLRWIGATEEAAALEARLALLFLVQQTAMGVLGTLLLPRSESILSRLSPVTIEERLERVEFIDAATTEDPDTAVLLLEREQQRLIGLMPGHLAAVRTDREPAATDAAAAPSATLLAAVRRVDGEIRGLAAELAEGRLDGVLVDRLLRLQQAEELALALHENLAEFAVAAAYPASGAVPARLRHNLVEGLDLIVATSVEAWASRDPIDVELLFSMTADRGELMERIRSVDLGGASIPVEIRSNLLYMTTLFERIVWMMHQASRLLAADAAPEGGADDTTMER